MWTRRGLLLGVWLAISAVAAVVVSLLPKVYKAETLILVESQRIPETLVSSTVRTELQDRLATISQQILSATQLTTVMEEFNLYPEIRANGSPELAVLQMQSDLAITLERGWSRNRPGAFRISYQGGNPQTVAAVANRVAGLYIDQNLQSRELQAKSTSSFLQAQLDRVKQDLEKQEQKLAEFKRTHSGKLPEQENSLVASLARIQVKVQGDRDALSRSTQNKLLLENSLKLAEDSEASQITGGQQMEAAKEVQSETAAAQKPRQSAQLEAYINNLLTRYTENYPEVVAARKALEAARERERAEDALPRIQAPKVETPRLPTSVDLQAEDIRRRQHERVGSLRAQLQALEIDISHQEKELKNDMAELEMAERRLGEIPLTEQEMAGIVRDYEVSKANYETLMGKNMTAGIAEDMEIRQQAERFTVLDPALEPSQPFKPNRIAYMAAGSAAGLFLSIGLIVAMAARRNVILGEWQLSPDIPVLGRVPAIHSEAESEPGRGRRRLVLASVAVLVVIASAVGAVLYRRGI